MHDRKTESLWSQLGMVAISGQYVGTELRWLSSEQMTWTAWREKFPGGRVLSTGAGGMDYSREAYAEYEQSGRPMFPVPTHRRELNSKDWVAGIIVDGQAKAYRLRSLPDNEFAEDEVAGFVTTERPVPLSPSATIRPCAYLQFRPTGSLGRHSIQSPNCDAEPLVSRN